jgi:decaprenyl-phosphate phosphoribosyltransferase
MSAEGVVADPDLEPPLAEARAGARPSRLPPLLRALRPQQWIKNLFVAAPLAFARHLGEPAYIARTALAVLAFCVLSGAVYVFNDVRDLDADRGHPTKRFRPIAAGEISTRAALMWAAVLGVASLAACLVLRWQLAAFAFAYLVQNIAYSIKLKQIAFVDVALIASGFMLRVLAGAAAIDVPASGWLLICTGLLATFLGLGKRAHELAWAERSGHTGSTRAALLGYKLGVVRLAMFALALLTCAAFVAYTVDERTIEYFGTNQLIYSAPFVGFGVLRFLALALWWPKDEPPTDVMMKDPWMLLDLAAATATILFVIYG